MFLLCASVKASPWVELQLDAPPQCPRREAIESAVARLVPRPPAVPLHVTARFAPDGERWVLYLAFESGQRVVAGDTCMAVAQTLVIMLALAIDPTAALGSSALEDLVRSTQGVPAPQNAPPCGETCGGSQGVDPVCTFTNRSGFFIFTDAAKDTDGDTIFDLVQQLPTRIQRQSSRLRTRRFSKNAFSTCRKSRSPRSNSDSALRRSPILTAIRELHASDFQNRAPVCRPLRVGIEFRADDS